MKDMEHLSNQDKIEYLFKMIDKEKSKPEDQINHELIENWSKQVSKLSVLETPELTPERITQIRLENTAYLKKHIARSGKKKKNTGRIIAAAVAAVFLLCSTAITVGARSENMGIKEYLAYMIKKKLPGERIDQDGITFIRYDKDEVTTYANLEQLLQEENPDIVFPVNLPESIYIKSITVFGELSGQEEASLDINFNIPGLYYSVCNDQTTGFPTNASPFETTVGTFYIFTQNDRYQAVCHTNEFEYIITATDEKTLISVLKGLQ